MDPNLEGHKLLGFLSTVLGSLQIGELHDLFNSHSKEDIVWLADQSRRNCQLVYLEPCLVTDPNR